MSFSSHQLTCTSEGLPLAAAAASRGESMARQMDETTMSMMISVSHTVLREMRWHSRRKADWGENRKSA